MLEKNTNDNDVSMSLLSQNLEDKLQANKNKINTTLKTAEIILILKALGQKIDLDFESLIKTAIEQKQSPDIGVIFFGLFQDNKIDRSLLVKLITQGHPLAKHDVIAGWWEREKNAIRGKYSQSSNNVNKKIAPQTSLNIFTKNSHLEKQLVEELKQEITRYCQENFYTYKSGNQISYSINPNEDGLGARFTPLAEPLTDEDGNLLTDREGNFRYAVISVIERKDGSFYEMKRTDDVTKDTPGATFLTDKNGISLAVKYREKISKDKPKNINRMRAEAANHLLQLINTVSADEIYQYITTPNFQTLIGGDEIRLNYLKINLIDICGKFTNSFKEHKITTTDAILLSIFLDDVTYRTLSSEALTTLFWHYNPYFLAEVVVNLYQDTKFKCGELDYQTLKKFLEGDQLILESINEKRCQFKVKPLLPPESRSPGKNTFEDEQLTKLQLFQYDDKTIAAAEQYLRTKYDTLIINAYQQPHYSTRLNPKAFYYFYQLPANSYMLLDPKDVINPNYKRYTNFKKNIKDIVYSKTQITKPIIFFGVINIDGVHYLPYFVHKNKSGKISVITVDPSPHIYPENKQNKQHIDTKKAYFLKAKQIFQDIFPGCRFFDPQTTQMLRERDCGPNSLQTVKDALETALTTDPLLFFNDNEELSINTSRLSLRGEPIGFNPYSQTFVYSSQLENKSNQNRIHWQTSLSQIERIIYFSRNNDDIPLSIDENFEFLPEEYNYIHQVNGQKLHDERYINISAVQQILLSDEAGRKIVNNIVADYKETLQLTNLNQLALYIKEKVDSNLLRQYTSAHQGNLNLLLEDVAGIILKDYAPEALENALQNLELNHLPERTDLDADRIVQDFLQKNIHVYKKLPPLDQITIRERLTRLTNTAIKEKYKAFYAGIIRDLVSRNCYSYLTKEILTNPLISVYALIQHITSKLEMDNPSQFFNDKDGKHKSDAIEKAITFLIENDYQLIYQIFEKEINLVANLTLKNTLQFAKQKFAINSMSLQTLLSFFNPQELAYTLPPPERFLPEKSLPLTLSLKEINSPLGAWLHNEVIHAFYKDINSIFLQKVQSNVNLFIKNHNFMDELINRELIQIDALLDNNGQLSFSMDFSQLIEKYGSTQTITADMYQHNSAKTFIQNELQSAASKLLLKARNDQFAFIADEVMQTVRESLEISNLIHEKPFDFQNLTYDLLNKALQNKPELEQFFNKNFLFYNSNTNSFEYSISGIRFYQFFEENYVNKLLTLYPNAIAFVDTIGVAITSLTDLGTQRIVVDSIIKELTDLSENLLSLTLNNFFESKFQILVLNMKQTLKEFITNLLANTKYIKGDITPGSIAVIIRPTLCSLMGIDTGIVLSPTKAKEIDELILSTVHKLTEKPTDKPGSTELPEMKLSPLLRLQNKKELPDTHKKPLTTQVLLELLSYWFSNRTSYTNLQNLFQKDHLPLIIYRLIKLLNKCYAEQCEPKHYLSMLQDLIPSNPSEQLLLFSSTDLTAQIRAALLKSQDFLGEDLVTTSLSFKNLRLFLKGQKVDSLKVKRPTKTPITQMDLDNKVLETYNKRVLDAFNRPKNVNAISINEEENKEISIDESLEEIRKELLQTYVLADEQEKQKTTTVTAQEFEKLVLTEFRERRNKLLKQAESEQNQLPDEQKEKIKIQVPNFDSVRTELKNQYTIITSEEKNEEDVNVNYLPQSQLQRKGMYSLTFFGDTELDKQLLQLQARHTNDDSIDEYDLHALKQILQERWYKLSIKGKEGAQSPYCHEKPNYRDSQYIAIAAILAQHFRKKGERIFMYELLMPTHFPSSKELRSSELPKKLIQELNSAVDLDNKSENTIDDIPLQDLVITRTGFALDINWVIYGYIKSGTFVNPYSDKNLNFSVGEIEDICRHPKAKELLEQVQANCIPKITPEAIDILEEYIIGSVFEVGYGGYYNEDEQKRADAAGEKFLESLKMLPKNQQKALWEERIPGSEKETVESTVYASIKHCATGKNTLLARVVIAYKGDNNRLPEFIRIRINSNSYYLPRREYATQVKQPKRHPVDEIEILEDFILEYFDKQQLKTTLWLK